MIVLHHDHVITAFHLSVNLWEYWGSSISSIITLAAQQHVAFHCKIKVSCGFCAKYVFLQVDTTFFVCVCVSQFLLCSSEVYKVYRKRTCCGLT